MERLYTKEEIKAAFRATFYRVGEVWFDYFNEIDAEKSIEDWWIDFEEHLP